jgi:hypothetical protein
MYIVFALVSHVPDYERDAVVRSFRVPSFRGFVEGLEAQDDLIEVWKDKGVRYVDHTSGMYVAFPCSKG